MALTLADSEVEEKNSGVKAEGDIGNFEVEDIADEKEDGGQRSRVNGALVLPGDLLKPSAPYVYGSVSVKQSENVQFGNNTYFNGPVTIKQIVQNRVEQDNLAYEHTEAEGTPASARPQRTDTKGTDDKPFEIQLWMKLTFSAIFVVVIGAIVSVVVVYSGQEIVPTMSNSEENRDGFSMVEGVCSNLETVNLMLVPLAVIILISIWCGLYNFVRSQSLLTMETGRDKNDTGLKSKEKNKCNAEDDPLLIAPNHLRIVDRKAWLARPVEEVINKLRQPAPWVIITHTDTESCYTQSECVLSVRLIQMFHVESRNWSDIGYNFLVAGDGSAYFGRGWDLEGAHTLGYNKYSIGIAFIGTFNNQPPPKKQIEACQKLIRKGIQLGKIAKDYKLFGHRQLASTQSPGDKLYDILKEWPHFVGQSTDIATIVPNY